MVSDSSAVVRLHFEGDRYRNRELDADALREIVRFQELVTAAAEHLWRLEHPQAQRLPQNFAERTRLVFDEAEAGSTTAPLRRPVIDGESLPVGLEADDETGRALDLICDALAAAEGDGPLPELLTPELAAKCSKLGTNLAGSSKLLVGFGVEPPHVVSERAREILAASGQGQPGTDFDKLDAAIQEMFGQITDEEWEQLPTDGARRLDFYLYGREKPSARDA